MFQTNLQMELGHQSTQASRLLSEAKARHVMAAAVEYAKSGRSQCFFCGQRITLDALRFRMPLEPKWRCLECFTLVIPEHDERNFMSSCRGMKALCADDRLLLTELLKPTYPPRKKRKGANILEEVLLRSEEHRGLRQCAREWARSETREAVSVSSLDADSLESKAE